MAPALVVPADAPIASFYARSKEMVLPPGYEDLLLCPPSFCVAPSARPAGFVGPRSRFFECAAVLSSERRQVTPWGSNDGPEALLGLLKDGFATTTCAQLESGVAAQLPESLQKPASPSEAAV